MMHLHTLPTRHEASRPQCVMMETQDDTTVGPLFHPLTGWEAASRWNAAAMDWWQHGFRQWVELMTASLVSPAQAGAEEAHAARSSRKAPDSRRRGNDGD